MPYQRVEHVAAGQFKTGKEDNSVYQAYLGTCLGVALYDPHCKIGGMIHILLPEPPGISTVDYPEKYASTGLPLLIKEMKKLGAHKENMKATIAGGALVGPVTQQDMNLDIGGRSAEIAAQILEASGIKVIKSETGGFFTCTLEMDLSNGDTRINPAWDHTLQTTKKFKAPSLDDIFQTIDQLKPIPQTALKIFRMFQSSRYHITDITDELSKDQVLSGQTLKLCNSALFAGMVKIETLKDAVLLMGEEMLVKSIITAAVNAYYNQTAASGGYSLCKGGLFYHAVGVAVMSEKIAQKIESPYAKVAYTAGLLHDIGKVILDQSVADSLPLFFRKMRKDNENFLGSEKKLLGITHSETGGILAKKWKFSNTLSDVILYHHTPEKSKENEDLAYIVYLADLIVEKFCAGFDLEKNPPEQFAPSLKRLGLSVEDIPELVDAIPVNAFAGEDMIN